MPPIAGLQLICPSVSMLCVSSSVRTPMRAAASAASVPAWPPPTTMTSNSSGKRMADQGPGSGGAYCSVGLKPDQEPARGSGLSPTLRASGPASAAPAPWRRAGRRRRSAPSTARPAATASGAAAAASASSPPRARGALAIPSPTILRALLGPDVREQGVAAARRGNLGAPAAERERERTRSLRQEAQARGSVAELQQRRAIQLRILRDLHAPVAIAGRAEMRRRTFAPLAYR